MRTWTVGFVIEDHSNGEFSVPDEMSALLEDQRFLEDAGLFVTQLQVKEDFWPNIVENGRANSRAKHAREAAQKHPQLGRAVTICQQFQEHMEYEIGMDGSGELGRQIWAHASEHLEVEVKAMGFNGLAHLDQEIELRTTPKWAYNNSPLGWAAEGD